jgi:formamidopyrimidine-DNA glycosylase
LVTYIAQKSYGARQSTLKRPAEKLIGKLLIEFGTTLGSLLAIGVERNAIITVFDGQLTKKRYGEKFNIFGKASCPKCEGEIRRFEISGRRTFVCDTCQPLVRQRG